jgi:hypothetical protein
MTSHWSEQKWLVLYVFVIFILSIIFAWGHSILQYFTRENLNKKPYWVGRFGLHEFLVEHLLKLEVAMSLQEFSLCGTAQCKGACYWKPWWNGWITCLRRRGLGRNLNGEAPNSARIVWLSKGTNVLRESPNRGQDLSLVMSGIWSLIGLTLCQHNRGWTWTDTSLAVAARPNVVHSPMIWHGHAWPQSHHTSVSSSCSDFLDPLKTTVDHCW